jgi:hypothetical protein
MPYPLRVLLSSVMPTCPLPVLLAQWRAGMYILPCVSCVCVCAVHSLTTTPSHPVSPLYTILVRARVQCTKSLTGPTASTLSFRDPLPPSAALCCGDFPCNVQILIRGCSGGEGELDPAPRLSVQTCPPAPRAGPLCKGTAAATADATSAVWTSPNDAAPTRGLDAGL